MAKLVIIYIITRKLPLLLFSPRGAVEVAVAYGFVDVAKQYVGAAVEVSDGAADLEYAVVCAG